MSINVNWENADKTIVTVTYQQPWTWGEFDAAHQELHSLMATVPHTVHIIMDVTHGGALKPNAVSRFRDVAKIKTPNQGMMIFVGANVFAQTIVQTIGKLTRSQTRTMQFASTRDEAIALIRNTT